MARSRFWRHGVLALLLILLAACGRNPGSSPPPPQQQPPQPPPQSQPHPITPGVQVGTSPPSPQSGQPHIESAAPPDRDGYDIDSAASPGTEPAANNPVFVDMGPAAPLQYREVGTISLAISYTKTQEQLKSLLKQERDAKDRPDATPRATSGNVANAPAGRYPYLMAKIESCLLMICDTRDDGVRSVANDPMVWHWAITPEHNEGGNTVIIVGLYGGASPTGPWIKVDAIPDIRERARIESRSWFLDNWDKALSMLGAFLAFLFTHWFRPGGRKEA